MRFITSKIVAVILLAYSLMGQAENINPNLWPTITNEEFGFRISYPSDWKEIKARGASVRVSVSPTTGPGNCNVVVREIEDTKSISQEQLNKEIDTMAIDDASWSEYLGVHPSQLLMTEKRRAKIVNIPAVYGEFEANIETLEGPYFGKKAVAITLTPGLLWTVTCGVSTYKPQEGRQLYNELQPYLIKIMGSFMITSR